MGNRVRLTNDTLNSYGYRVLTDGVDITQYERNPILLYMHNRGKAIGLIKDISKENGEITGELAFDEATELSTQCKKQWEFGSLRMVSIGFEVIETSEAAEFIVPGQRPGGCRGDHEGHGAQGQRRCRESKCRRGKSPGRCRDRAHHQHRERYPDSGGEHRQTLKRRTECNTRGSSGHKERDGLHKTRDGPAAQGCRGCFRLSPC